MPALDRDHLIALFDYHQWANDLVFESVAGLSASDLDAAWGGSFGNGRGLLRHVVGVESLWADRLRGRTPTEIPAYPATHDGGDFVTEWRRVCAEHADYVSSLTSSMLQGELTYTSLKGERCTFRLPQVLLHVVNHGTYHRGQLAHLLRDRGRPVPSTDYLIYAAERRREG